MQKRFTEEQIVRILQEAEGGMSTRDIRMLKDVNAKKF